MTGRLRGCSTTGIGAFDLDRQARDNGANPDIGADELVAPDTPSLTGTSPASGADDNNPEFLGTSDPTTTLYARAPLKKRKRCLRRARKLPA